MADHIVWDWNGTLFHDLDALLVANNEICRSYGLAALDSDTYRQKFTRPVWRMYERMLGRRLRPGEWQVLDEQFQHHYHRLSATCGLTDGALDCLVAWAATGRTQSLLSMWDHGRLVVRASELGIAPYLHPIDGTRVSGAGGGHKAPHLLAHIRKLPVPPHRIVVIGDTLDDARAAHRAGAHAVLYTQGQTTPTHLEQAGVPLANTLSEALHHATHIPTPTYRSPVAATTDRKSLLP